MRRALILTMAAAGLLAPAASGIAATATAASDITIGQTVRGTLTDSDGRWADDSRFDRYRFRGEAGTWVTITMDSTEMDTYLHLRKTGELGYIATDDDGGDGNNAKLNVFIPVTGDYDIIANGSDEDDRGAYTLKLERDTSSHSSTPRLGGAQTATSRALKSGETLRGTLRDSDPKFSDGQPYQLFKITLTGGRSYSFDMKSDGFDTRLVLRRPGEVGIVEENDDGCDDTNAHLDYEPDDTGEYELIATRISSGTGEFSLTANQGTDSCDMDDEEDVKVEPIAYGRTIEGSLGSGDNLDDDVLWYDSFSFEGKAGETVVITVDANGFDPLIQLYNPDDDKIAEDDDGGQGLNSRLEYKLAATGTHFIDVRSSDNDDTGTYTLKLVRQ